MNQKESKQKQALAFFITNDFPSVYKEDTHKSTRYILGLIHVYLAPFHDKIMKRFNHDPTI